MSLIKYKGAVNQSLMEKKDSCRCRQPYGSGIQTIGLVVIVVLVISYFCTHHSKSYV